MYLETDAMCKEIRASSDFVSVFSTSQTKHDVVVGPMIKLKTNTPVIGDFRNLGSLFWGRMIAGSGCTEELSGTGTQDHKNCRDDKDVKEILFHVALHSPEAGDIKATDTTAIAKLENDRRAVFAFKPTIAVPGCHLLSHEYGRMVLTDFTLIAAKGGGPATVTAPPSPPPAVFLKFYRLHTDLQQDNAKGVGKGATSTAEAQKYYQDFVMKSLSNKMCAHQHQIQNLLLAEIETNSTASMPKQCPHNLSCLDASDASDKKT